MGSGSHSSKRKKKHSQKRSKRKSKGIKEKKLKKLKRQHDSVSCSDDDSASAVSLSWSSSSLEDDRRTKKRSKSRDGRDRKRSKRSKRARSRSESSEDSPRVKKRKRSKRDRDSGLRKKRRGKKRRREPSISSSSDRSSDDSEGESGRKGEKLAKRKREGREKSTERSASKRSRHSSRSSSPCSLRSESYRYDSEERKMEEYHPKRLKSVIVAPSQAEVRESDRDSHKDEIVYEHDDYPSRSNDSNDGVNRRDALPYVDDATNVEARSFEDPNREAVTSDVRSSDFQEIQSLGAGRTVGVNSTSVGSGVGDNINVGDNIKVNGNDNFTVHAGPKSDGLEATLRQKALENLLKRQGRLPTKIPTEKKGDRDSEVNKALSSFDKEPLCSKPDKEGNINSVQKVERKDDVTIVGFEEKDNAASANIVISRPKLGLPTPTRRLLGSNTWKREVTAQESHQPIPSTSRETLDNMYSAKGSGSMSVDTKEVAEEVGQIAASDRSAAGEECAEAETSKADEESEFQQKTMTVMRGGELVQVSYKVKIPKRPPALARRQLKR